MTLSTLLLLAAHAVAGGPSARLPSWLQDVTYAAARSRHVTRHRRQHTCIDVSDEERFGRDNRAGNLSKKPPAHFTPFCGFNALIIQDVPNLSLSCPKRVAKNVSSMGMKICPPSQSSAQMRSASTAL